MSQSYQNNNYCNRVALIIIKSVEACIPKPIQTCLHANSLVLMLSHEKRAAKFAREDPESLLCLL